MQAIHLIKHGDAATAFEIREANVPTPTDNQVLIAVAVFGLNYADVMARLGMYEDAPPLPSILGYEVVGNVTAIGKNVVGIQVGDRVVGMTRFGGYAKYAVTDYRAVAVIPDTMDASIAAALATQYITAYYAACEQVSLHKGDKVVIHAAAGGVGIALVQLAKHKGCHVFGTCGSDEKVAFLKSIGVDTPINYLKDDWATIVKNATQEHGVDVIFDSIGGSYVKKGIKLLGAGGRLVSYGVSEMTSGHRKSTLQMAKVAVQFGIYSPIEFLQNSKAFIGINMLRIADDRPLMIQHCLASVVALQQAGVLAPHIGGSYPAQNIADAHHLLGNRGSVGKIVCYW
jgi:NADPH:quinone reductase-like Zn-dependent oxidoreductase